MISQSNYLGEIALGLSKILRREVLETDSKNFPDMVDKICGRMLLLTRNYIKQEEKNVPEWIEREYQITIKFIQNKK